MAEMLIQSESLTSIADKIRVLSGTEDAMSLNAMETHVGEANEDVATEADLIAQIASALDGKAGGGEQATPVISVNSSGLITATAGTKSSTHQLAFQPAKTITPSTASQIAVSSGYYTGGNVTVAAVPTQTKTVTPTSSTQNVTPDSGKFLSKVTVNAIPSTYVQPSYTKAATTYTPSTINKTISAGTYLTGVQTIKGDSNLVAGNIKSGVSIFGVSGNYEGSGGDTSAEDSIITKTISSYTNDRVSSIGQGAFAYADNLKSVSFPVTTTIGSSAFCDCTSLTTISFPKVTTIGNNAFEYCSKLTTASFPAATSIGGYAFYGCSKLTTASFPAATSIGGYAFYDCSKLTTASFPKVATIGYNAFSNCRSLTTISFPVTTTIGSSAFHTCIGLTTASFPAATTIGGSAFSKCYNLKSLYLTGSSLCKLSHSNAFTSTPIGGYSKSAGTYGSIYVPASLLTPYQTATNWTYFSSRFVGI